MDEQKEVSATDLIKEAKEAVNSLKAENDRKRQLLDEEKELEARKILGGGSVAGQAEKPKPVEETPKEYARRVIGLK
jgi:hypothetical protein